MSRPDPIEYAERLYTAIRAANFSPISFLAFGNAVKEGVSMRNMPRIAVEPFMRVVGEMLDLEEAVSNEAVVDGDVIDAAAPVLAPPESRATDASEATTASETTDDPTGSQRTPSADGAPPSRSKRTGAPRR